MQRCRAWPTGEWEGQMKVILKPRLSSLSQIVGWIHFEMTSDIIVYHQWGSKVMVVWDQHY